jgi:hypothetical protein
MMKKIAFLIITVISYSISFGQDRYVNSSQNLFIDITNKLSLEKETYIDGSPYKSKDFVKALFFQKGGAAIESETRLNFYRSNFEFKLENSLYMVEPQFIDSIKIKDQTYLFKSFDFNGKTSARAVELIGKSDKSSLYSFTGVEFKPEVKAGGYVDPKPASYQWDEPVYLIETGEKLIALTNFNKLTSAIPLKEKEIKQFIKTNKIKKDDPVGLQKLVNYVDQLN